MPNWCDNSVKINGPIDKLYNMVKAVEKDQLLNHLVPIGDWDYNVANTEWGTKWDISEGDVTANEDYTELSISFHTAWGPPTEAFETYMSLNNDVEITNWYYEGGNDFCGVNGEHRDSLPAYQDPIWDQDDVLKECDDMFGIRESMAMWDDEEEED